MIITDVIMPGKSGIELITKFKSDDVGIKVLAISGGTGNKANGYLQLALGFGADAALGKPISVESLLSAVRQLIGGADGENF